MAVVVARIAGLDHASAVSDPSRRSGATAPKLFALQCAVARISFSRNDRGRRLRPLPGLEFDSRSLVSR